MQQEMYCSLLVILPQSILERGRPTTSIFIFHATKINFMYSTMYHRYDMSAIHRVIATGKLQWFEQKAADVYSPVSSFGRGLIWGLALLHIEYWNCLGIISKDKYCAQSSLGCCMECGALDWSWFQWAVRLGRLKIHSKREVCLCTDLYRGNPREYKNNVIS